MPVDEPNTKGQLFPFAIDASADLIRILYYSLDGGCSCDNASSMIGSM